MKLQTSILSNLRRQESLYEYTKWKRLSGPRYKHMDEKYQKKIISKLFPMLRKYGINMLYRPIEDSPGSQLYVGRDSNGNRVSLEFINKYEPGLDNRVAKYDMFVKVGYKDEVVDGGVVDLNKKSHVEDAFSIITMTLENLGANNNNEEPSEDKEDTTELDNLLAFRDSLNEEDLLDIK